VCEQRIVVTKDEDFVRTFLLRGEPPDLLLVATGNIANSDLEELLRRHWSRIETALATSRFVELQCDVRVIRT